MPATCTTQSKRVPFDARRADLAEIHIAKKELGWSDDEYRDIMATVCGGVRSSGSLDVSGRQRFIAHIRACKNAGKHVRPAAPKSRLSARDGKLWSLWMQLADARLVQHRKMTALNAFAERQSGVARIEWLNEQQYTLVVESLKYWLARGA